jgi:hypothetical protein
MNDNELESYAPLPAKQIVYGLLDMASWVLMLLCIYGLLRGSWDKAFWVLLAYIVVWAPQRIDEALTAWKNRK